jgi:hypothetical protein
VQGHGPQPASQGDLRSPTSIALAVLSIVFGSIGVAGNLFALAASTVFARHPLSRALGVAAPFDAVSRFELVDACLKVPTAIVLIVVGVGLYRQREWSRRWAIGWAVGALVVLVVTEGLRVVILAAFPPVVATLVLASYPIVLLVLLTRTPTLTPDSAVTRAPATGAAMPGPPMQQQGLPAWAWVLITLGGVGFLCFAGCMVCTTAGAVATAGVVQGVFQGMSAAKPHAAAPGVAIPVAPPPTPPAIAPPIPVVPTAPTAPLAPSLPVAPSPPTDVALAKLVSDYNDDEARADELYRGKTLRTRGKVKDTPKSAAGRPFFTVGTGAGVEINTVQCNVRAASSSATSTLAVGTPLTVQGRCTGRNLTHIVLDDCVFVR